MMNKPARVVIVGGGFAGLNVARSLARVAVDITLVDRRNFHLFQPLLYQVATCGLSPANIAAPLRAIVKKQRNIRVLLGEVTDISVANRQVHLRDEIISYDYLVVATGASHSYFGNDNWETYAPGLKTIEDALEIRRRVLLAFEAAERQSDPRLAQELLTFVVVGAGPTGVELAGALADVANHALRHDFRRINPADAKIVLVEAGDRVLAAYPPDLSASAAASLQRLGVHVRTRTAVMGMDAKSVTVRHGEETETIAAHTILWAAGVQASPLAAIIAREAGATLDRAGRVIIEPDLTVKGHKEVFAIGDICHLPDANGKPLPGIAPVAIQQGKHVAATIRAYVMGKVVPAPFYYRHRGNMATIERAAAVADLGWCRFSGFFAWLAWLFVHLIFLIMFQNRVLVLTQWAWNYFTRHRSARLITGDWGKNSQNRTS